MLGGIISCIKGSFTLKCEGRFPERILNIASTSGIYVYDVRRISPTALTFCVSKKGCDALQESVPEGLSLSTVDSYGLPVFMRRYKKRAFLILLPIIFIITSSTLSLFIWRVDISGGNKKLKEQVEEIISKNGVYTGALKHKIDRYDVKRKAILSIDDLSWLWVDIKGTTAYVKIKERTRVPSMSEIHEPADVIARHSGVIEKMQVYCGVPLISEGMTVEKGQIIVSGVLKSEKENIPTYYHHACADVTVRLTEKKTVIIPKKSIRKIPTGEKKNVFTVNFKKNKLKFSLNSGISYTEYDKIEKTVKIPFLPVSFSRTTYHEVVTAQEDTDTASLIDERRTAFTKELAKKDMQIESMTDSIEDNENSLSVTFSADCLVRTDKEIPIKSTEGEINGKDN